MKFKQKGDALTAFILFMVFVVVPIAAWITHIITCFDTERWGFLIAGAIFFPVAIFHGIWIWF